LRNPRTGFEKARRDAKLEHVLFHDMRRTAVRNMIKAGIPRKRAMEISGHRTESIFNRYDIGTEDDAVETGVAMRNYIQKLAAAEKLVVELVVPARIQPKHNPISYLFSWCWRWGSNPHVQ
jgi:Phage integrase family